MKLLLNNMRKSSKFCNKYAMKNKMKKLSSINFYTKYESIIFYTSINKYTHSDFNEFKTIIFTQEFR